MLYRVLRGRWCNIVLNVHPPSEEKSDDSKDSFYEELEQIFDDFSKYHVKIILGILIQKWGDRIFSTRQFGIRVYIRIVRTVVFEK